MAEAGFFYNTTTQRVEHPQRPPPRSSAASSLSTKLQQSARPFLKERASPAAAPASTKDSPSSPSSSGSTTADDQPVHSSSTSRTKYYDLERPDFDHMLSTPLPDYRHSANQTTKGRARAQAARKNSSSAAAAAERKHALHAAAESRTPMAMATASVTVTPTTRAAAAAAEAAGRTSSISSHTGSSGLTAVTSSDPPVTDALLAQPFARRNGRRCLRDTTLPYPLPCDLNEIHRQTLRTMLLCQVFNGPVCSDAFDSKPPKRVLEVGCGTGFWSVMCHKHFSRQGHSSISFTGIDIAPLSPQIDSDDDINWRFVQHDLRRVPLPFRDEEFSLIMIKDLSLVTPTTGMPQALMDEYLRILKPGGALEIWDGDHSLRMLLPHALPETRSGNDDSKDDGQAYTNAMGVYTITAQTPFAAPHNQYLLEFNSWISKAFEARKLTPMPCTTMRPMLLQEADTLVEIDSRRLAIPLGEVRWEKEGIGGAMAISPNGHGAPTKGKSKESDHRTLTTGQAALRRTALTTVVQMIESLEPLLKEASGKGQDEWDRWHGSMMKDLLQQSGTSWGECLEVGAWWARKKKPSG